MPASPDFDVYFNPEKMSGIQLPAAVSTPWHIMTFSFVKPTKPQVRDVSGLHNSLSKRSCISLDLNKFRQCSVPAKIDVMQLLPSSDCTDTKKCHVIQRRCSAAKVRSKFHLQDAEDPADQMMNIDVKWCQLLVDRGTNPGKASFPSLNLSGKSMDQWFGASARPVSTTAAWPNHEFVTDFREFQFRGQRQQSRITSICWIFWSFFCLRSHGIKNWFNST